MKKVAVKKLDVSDVISNLTILSSAVVASLPLLLGDQLVIVASRIANVGSIVIQEWANTLLMWLS
jgi:hypothetical protein